MDECKEGDSISCLRGKAASKCCLWFHISDLKSKQEDSEHHVWADLDEDEWWNIQERKIIKATSCKNVNDETINETKVTTNKSGNENKMTNAISTLIYTELKQLGG